MNARIGILLLLLVFLSSIQAQEKLPFLQPADSLHSGRFWTCLTAGTTIYTGVAIGLYDAWYKGYELVGFHTFDDRGEWLDMDKTGHLFSAYLAANLSFNGARWTGMNRRSATWTAVGVGTLIQSTIEVMDAFSAKWGFSWADVGFNTLGVGLFASQEMLWQEQRIIMKVSSSFPSYSNTPFLSEDGEGSSSLKIRTQDLYGKSLGERFLKDYNGQTTWASVNIASFLAEKPRWLPSYLNIAVGYGAENLFGGYSNTWTDENDHFFQLSTNDYPRYRQFYLSFDIDLDRIQTNSRFLKTLLHIVNWIKIPSPTLELNTRGQLKFHPIYW